MVGALIGHSETNSMSVPLDQLGPPGSRCSFFIVPIIKGDTRTSEEIMGDTAPRQFTVSARLSKSPLSLTQINGGFDEGDGNSYLLIPSGKSALDIQTQSGHFNLKMNQVRELSFAHFTCNASSHLEAKVKFINEVFPLFDHFSHKFDVPIFVTMIRVYDEKNKTTTVDFTSPHGPTIVEDTWDTLHNEMKPVYSMYREAKNSDSEFYRFLCYYKIMEGLLGKMRAKAHKRAKQLGIKLSIDEELVPKLEDVPNDLTSYVGKSIKKIFDEVFTHKFRNSIAHFITADDKVLHVSSPFELFNIQSVSYVSERCARIVIRNHEKLLTQLAKSASPNPKP